ncbi:hypothetical protein SDC9_196198 [bioreactor metagenome]|uniref:Uncharacterized protein n=1 Tax=bioreactor metagenome TaxID=1076179 RepID=A0A645IBC9_9ZZZZ
MVHQAHHGVVHIAVVHHGAVIAGEDDKRILIHSRLLQSTNHFTHRPVELNDGVPPVAHIGFAPEPFVRITWHMDIVGAEIEEERPVFVLFNKTDRTGCDAVGNRFIFPKS